MTDLAFDDLRWLHLGWAAAAALALGLLGLARRRAALRRFASAGLLPRLAPTGSVRWLRLALLSAAAGLLVVALIGPRWGERFERLVRRNIDVVILLDVSRSMLARDIAPNRLERAKLSIREDLLPTLGGDRIAIVPFAGATSSACPLTSDYGFVRLALDEVTPRSVGRGGTLIGDAIRRGVEQFDPNLDTHRVILLITDGEDHASFPLEAAAGAWSDQRVSIISVAIGDAQQGARIPASGESGSTDYLKYHAEEVWSRADFDLLQRIAESSPLGVFVPAGTSNFDLGAIYRQVAGAIRADERVENRRATQPARFHPFVLGALALALVESAMRDGPHLAESIARARKRREAA